MRYVRRLDFFETPDYDYLHDLFMNVMRRNSWRCDWKFDWTEAPLVRRWNFFFDLVFGFIYFDSLIDALENCWFQ